MSIHYPEHRNRLFVSLLQVKRYQCTPLGLAQRLSSFDPVFVVEGVIASNKCCKLVGAGSTLRFKAQGQSAQATWGDKTPVLLPEGDDPLAQLVGLQRSLSFIGPSVAPILRSFFGFMAYDAVRCFERLAEPKPTTVPDYDFTLPEIFVLFEHDEATIVCISSTEEPSETLQLVRHMMSLADLPWPENEAQSLKLEDLQGSFSPDGYQTAVKRAKEYIVNGDIFQVVLSVRLNVPYSGCPLSTFQSLTQLNPSPFQYCFLSEDYSIIGASPEPLVMASARHCVLHPLAGTRPRGKTLEEDQALECELRDSEKEKAEHRMLVDLARNDLGRVSAIGTVGVTRMMEMERFSHVMHLISRVESELAANKDIEDLLRSCFPAGTMAGAPKIRAMEIIDELEPVSRGFYSGGVGMLTDDELTLYILIRSVVIQNAVASLQAGAGIVYDSDPQHEYWECITKLRAALCSLGLGKI